MSMHRVVVSTVDGVVLAEHDVASAEVAPTLALLILQTPDAVFYVDGYTISDQDRAFLFQNALAELAAAAATSPPAANTATPASPTTAAASAAAPSTAPVDAPSSSTPPPTDATTPHVRELLEPPAIKSYQDLVLHTLSQAHVAQVLSLTNFHEVARKFSDMWIERERLFADEAARQRSITRQSLADIDLLGRSVKLAQLTEMNQAMHNVGASFGAGRGRAANITVMDAASGLVRLLGMMKQLGG